MNSATRDLLREFGLVRGREGDTKIRSSLTDLYKAKTQRVMLVSAANGKLASAMVDDYCRLQIRILPNQINQKATSAVKIANLAIKYHDASALKLSDYSVVESVINGDVKLSPSNFNSFIFRV
jgi:thiazole synthase ThiGH ThiG subunit